MKTYHKILIGLLSTTVILLIAAVLSQQVIWTLFFVTMGYIPICLGMLLLVSKLKDYELKERN